MKLSKAEKTVIFATLFCVIVMCGVGYFRLQKVDDKQYASKLPSEKEVFSKLRLKENPLIIEAGSKISKNPAFYYEGNKSVLADIKLDVSNVDSSKLGSYTVKATYQGLEQTIQVEVKDTQAPQIVTAADRFTFEVNDYSTIDEVMTMVEAHATDAFEGSVEIEPWIDYLPYETATYTYELIAKDTSGNTSTKTITISYVYTAAYDNAVE
ncbi:bacterial Ig-like domain-containing protein [Amedibacillus dolichus]|uniref:bacterial Ig-like domain-containing protein n=1 Tax=Amedibacillus dolichus TaxID=31971 RepID=UPI00243156AD|nr:bacterial Ig-like domain-containing protein [Amedibacillus dolichus]